MVNSVRLSKTPRTICCSRSDSLSERAISRHARSLNIVEPGACRCERKAWGTLAGLFTTPYSQSHGKTATTCRYLSRDNLLHFRLKHNPCGAGESFQNPVAPAGKLAYSASNRDVLTCAIDATCKPVN